MNEERRQLLESWIKEDTLDLKKREEDVKKLEREIEFKNEIIEAIRGSRRLYRDVLIRGEE